MRILIALTVAAATLAGTAHAQDLQVRRNVVAGDVWSGPQTFRSETTTVLSDAPRSPATVDAYGNVLVAESVGAATPRGTPYEGICTVAHGACPAVNHVVPLQACNCLIPGFGDEVGITR